MKKTVLSLISIIPVFFSNFAFGLQFEIIDKQGKVLFLQDLSKIENTDVGAITFKALHQAQASGVIKDFNADESGVASIENISNDLEVLSDDEMRAWGWCFSIDQRIPETLPAKTKLTGQEKKLIWFYGFAHYIHGEWVSQCESHPKLAFYKTI